MLVIKEHSGERQSIFSDHRHYKHLLKTMPSHPLIHNSLGVLNSIWSRTENILTDSATLYSHKSYELCRVKSCKLNPPPSSHLYSSSYVKNSSE